MSRRRRRRTGKSNLMAHRRIIADPQVMALIRALRREWKKINPIERGERLQELAKRGCSTRGLGNGLRQSPTTVRRYLTLAGLPEEQREAVKAGSSAKNILDRKARADRMRRMRKRIAEDGQTGKWSNRIADIILTFCRRVDNLPEFPVLEGDLPEFVNSVRQVLFEFQKRGAPAIRLSRMLTPKQRFQRTRPQPDPDQFWMVQQARWLATLIWSEAREEPIWDRALEKAERRRSELRVKMTPLERWVKTRERLADITAGPSRRRY